MVGLFKDGYTSAAYIDEHSDLSASTDMIIDAWFDYWIDVKKKTVRPNT